MIPALFVYYGNALEGKGRVGGVQICTREFVNILLAAGFHLKFVRIDNDMRIVNRIKRKFLWKPYQYAYRDDQCLSFIRKALDKTTRYVFLNQAVLRPLGKMLRSVLDESVRIVLLSHGLPSTDELHRYEIDSNLRHSHYSWRQKLWLAEMLIEEGRQGPYLDHVFCLSPFDEVLERWRGARNVTWLPRLVEGSALDWQPRFGRFGYVGTLDHPPNYEGLVLLLNRLESYANNSIDIRIVGGPEQVGQEIARRYQFVKYLGPLTDAMLRAEAATWNAFLHPLFRLSMGSSMKLAIAIGWEIPIVTTTCGRRGYLWKEGEMPIADDPDTFTQLVLRLTEKEFAYRVRAEISKIKASSPNLADVATMVRRALGLDQDGGQPGSNKNERA